MASPNVKWLLCFMLSIAVTKGYADQLPTIVGRWDIVVHDPSGDFPSWLEVSLSGHKTLVGKFVAPFGSARPISKIFLKGSEFNFSIPVQWEDLTTDQWMKGTISGDKITGTTLAFTGKEVSFEGVRAPLPHYVKKFKVGTPIKLFDGSSLKGWGFQGTSSESKWIVKKGILTNEGAGLNLVSEQKFKDFKIQVEFRYPKAGNSGVFLRGRYEAQIEDPTGLPADSHRIGGIYGFLTPKINAARKAGEWQSYDITLVDRFVTIVLNGETVISEQEIPGITGGALDSRESEPGPIMLQGDHTAVEYRKVILYPIQPK